MVLRFKKFLEGKIYQDILQGYGDAYTKLKQKWNISPNKEGYFEELPAGDFIEDLLIEYYKPGFKLLDIGCGLGNILKLSNIIGYQSTGIEINKNLVIYHNELDVIYGDILNLSDYRFLKNFDIIYLYRPIRPLDKCDKLFEILYNNVKNNCTIIYIYPSQLELNLKRKFEYKKFKHFNYMYKDGFKKPPTIVGTYYLTYNYDKITDTRYSIMKIKKNVIDINIEKILNDCFEILKDYNKKDEKYNNTHYHSFICDDDSKFDDFKLKVSEIKELLNKYKLDISVDEGTRKLLVMKYTVIDGKYYEYIFKR